MHIKPFQAVFPNTDLITSAATFFGTVKEEYPNYVQSGFFSKVAQEAIYVYQIREREHTYTGLVTCAAIEDYLEGHIRKHENPLPAKEQQQIHLLLRRNAQVKPVLLTYPPVEAIDAFTHDLIASKEPFLQIRFEPEEDEVHTFWEIKDDGQIRLIQALFEQYVPYTYIADGHHRTSTTAIMHHRQQNKPGGKLYDRFLCALFPTSELEILDFNRAVEGLNGHSPTQFMALLSSIVQIEPLREVLRPRQKHEVVMNLNREWFALRWKKRILRQYVDEEILLDVRLLNEWILQPILGIDDVREDARLRYVEGTRGLEGTTEKLVKSDDLVGFFLYPVSMEDFLHISDVEQVLPPKSTWFEPRMRNGLIVQEY